jgi:hypothetical protein
MNYTPDVDVVSFKVIGGEEIVAKFITEDDKSFTIYKPLSMVASERGLAMSQTMYSSKLDQELKLNKSAVIMHAKSRDEIVAGWYSATSGIQTPKSQILMG